MNKFDQTFRPIQPEYLLPTGKVSKEPNELLDWYKLPTSGGDNNDALNHCPGRVRAAIFYHYVWQVLMYSREKAVQQMVFANESACSYSSGVLQYTHCGVSGSGSLQKGITVKAYGQSHTNRLLGSLGKLNNERQTRGMNVSKIDFSKPPVGRIGYGDTVSGYTSNMEYFPGIVGRVNSDRLDWLNKYYVRPKKQVVVKFFEAAKPLFYPYLHNGFEILPADSLCTEIVYPQSRKYRKRIPIALYHYMEEATLLLPHALWQAIHVAAYNGRDKIKDEIDLYCKAREDYGYSVLCKQASLKQAMAEYDAFAEIGYLTPTVMPRRQTLSHGEIHFPGLTGERVELPAVEGGK